LVEFEGEHSFVVPFISLSDYTVWMATMVGHE